MNIEQGIFVYEKTTSFKFSSHLVHIPSFQLYEEISQTDDRQPLQKVKNTQIYNQIDQRKEEEEEKLTVTTLSCIFIIA